jgi:hypothetical protein
MGIHARKESYWGFAGPVRVDFLFSALLLSAATDSNHRRRSGVISADLIRSRNTFASFPLRTGVG